MAGVPVARKDFMKFQLARLKKLIRRFTLLPPVWKTIARIPQARNVIYRNKSGLFRKHPIDRFYCIDTSGFVDVEAIYANTDLQQAINPYAGSQPSVIRTALRALGAVSDYSFIDLGCGKGRVLAVASEFPFQEIYGVELSSRLAAKARSNAAAMAMRFPNRPHVTIAQTNAVAFTLPPGKLVLFNFHSFGAGIVAQVVRKLEAALEAGTSHIFFVYYNPVHADSFDASPAFQRYFAGNVPYDRSELGFGFAGDKDDAVVIWQSVQGAVLPQQPGADREIAVIEPLWLARIAD